VSDGDDQVVVVSEDAPALDIPDLGKAVLEQTVRKWRQYPTRSNRASVMGHPCERWLVYKRVAWEREERPDPVLLSIFEEGGLHERDLERELKEAGFTIIEGQVAIEYPEVNISGRVDGGLVLAEAAGRATVSIPIDYKSVSEHTFESIATAEDVRDHKYVYTRSWYTQMQLYCLLKNRDVGLIILKSKSTGLVKQVEVHLDYKYAEEILKKAERVNAHVKAGTLPDRIEYVEDICGRCSFFSVCLPDAAARAGIALLDNPEMLALIRRRVELKAAADEYARIDRQFKDAARQAFDDMEIDGRGELIVNAEFIVRRKPVAVKEYIVPAGVREQITIDKLGKVAEA
jgi:CRISPR/Cas system-associated exonuclease Cas4 (RecB family)